jgi:predicted GTPase
MAEGDRRTRTLILGAAGRDFHNFNVVYRDDPAVEVVAITAAQIPGIAGRRYPPALAGPYYPEGIPIVDEAELEAVCRRARVDQVVFAYSDVSHASVMHAASRALAVGADFVLLGPRRTMLASSRPVVSVTAARTGCGKSQVCRRIAAQLRAKGVRVVAIRHPMPYGDLERQRVQRFATMADLDAAQCTNEEREEYAPHISAGGVVFAGVDTAAVLVEAEKEAEVIIWDGGNNDFSFIKPDLDIALVDALRPGQAASYHPGETALRRAEVVIVNKVDAAPIEDVDWVIREVRALNPSATLVRAASPVRLDDPGAVRGRGVLVIEDGPTITHGGLSYGAGYVAAQAAGAAEVVDPRRSAPPVIQAVYERYPHIGPVLPAVGYDARQLEGLRQTIESSEAEVVVVATPIDLATLIPIRKPVVRAHYDYADAGVPTLGAVVDEFMARERMPAC